ncbi:sensor histidine kinase [Halovenus salina]|uniref:sensor histidine kinase n=1 Tax=Halovenus salina TaxID=1510225 RepID=UPI0022609915|nr:GAF domain-containing sensor histidine kinase [Halovenus salina]
MEDNDQARSEYTDSHLDGETLEQLHRAATTLYAADSIEESARQTVSAAIEILGFEGCLIARADSDMFRTVAIEGAGDPEASELTLGIGEGIVGAAFAADHSRIDNDISEVPETTPSRRRIESALTVPIGDWGVFQAVGYETDAFEEGDRRLVELLVAPLATTIDRIQRETTLEHRTAELQRQNSQIEAIHTVSTAMKLTTEKDDIYDLFVETVEQVLDIAICTLDERVGDVLKTRAVGSDMNLEDFYTETPLNQTDSLAVESYDAGETVVVGDLEQTAYRAASSDYQSVISVPLGRWGIFQAATQERNAFDGTERQIIELLADSAEAAIERIERQKELERRAHKLEAQNERLDQFASRLSHEMRNPLSVLEARLSLARETGDKEHFEHMERSIQRMSRLIDDTLALARDGGAGVMVEPVRLDRLTTECWQHIRTPNTGLVVNTTATVRADTDRLHQLLSNLLRNAVEHTGNGVIVTVGDFAGGFYVEDDGPGIPPSDREAVLTSGTTDLAHGTGLGLAVVKSVVEDHGWSLRVTESKDGGARFEIRDVALE